MKIRNGFAGCDKIVCVKSWDDYEIGRVYNCKLDGIFFTIGAKEYLIFDGLTSNQTNSINSILESFITFSERRRTIIENFL